MTDLKIIEEAFPLQGDFAQDAKYTWPSRWEAVKDDLAHVPEVDALCDYKAAAIYFAEELFSLINYRRAHSLSREIWHEADAHDEQGNRCIAFLLSEGLLVNDSEEHPTWYRHKDPEKRAKPPSFDNLAVRSPQKTP